MPYISRVLGPQGIGEYSYTYSNMSYFLLFAASGTASFAQREIVRFRSEVNKRNDVFWNIVAFRTISTVVLFLLYIGFVFSLSSAVDITLYLIESIVLFSCIFDITWYFYGIENFKVITIRNVIVKLITTATIFLFVKESTDLWIYALILSFGTFVGNLVMWVSIKDIILSLPKVKLELKKLLKPVIELFIPVIAVQIYTVVDKTMLGYFADVTQVAYYDQAEKIIKLIITIMGAFYAVLMPRFTDWYKSGKRTELIKYCNKSIDFTFSLGIPLIIGCCFTSAYFVPWFFGSDYTQVAIIMNILSPLFVILSFGQLLGTILVAIYKQNKYTIAVVSAAIINFVFNYIFIRLMNYGALGAAFSTIIAELVATAIQFYFGRELLNVKYVFHSFISYLWKASVMGVCLFFLQRVNCNNFVHICINVVIGGAVYLLLCIICKYLKCRKKLDCNI